MVGIYFSGTGNSRYAAEFFCNEYDETAKAFSIEDAKVIDAVKNDEMLVFTYPVQYSTVSKILRDYIIENKELWKNKKVFVIATMGLFSGDGAGILGRLLQQYGAEIIGGLHLKMPDSIGDEKVLKRPLEKNKEFVKKAEQKISKAVQFLKSGVVINFCVSTTKSTIYALLIINISLSHSAPQPFSQATSWLASGNYCCSQRE